MTEDLEHTTSIRRNQNFRAVVSNILFASIYIITGKFGLSLAFVNVSATPVWPPAGITLAAFLFFGYRIWPEYSLGHSLSILTDTTLKEKKPN